jgi:hypothetical protein
LKIKTPKSKLNILAKKHAPSYIKAVLNKSWMETNFKIDGKNYQSFIIGN